MQEHNYNNDSIITRYQKLIDSGKVADDPAQKEVIRTFYKLQQDIELKILQESSNFLKKIFSSDSNSSNVKGIYLYGDVGRGKSMLMDLFFETSSLRYKRRVHFHAFMLEVHRTLFQWRSNDKNQGDPIAHLAKNISAEAQLLCFDELQVTDIADAMLLGRLFQALFDNGVIVVATSNRPPLDLYKDGLQRERFLPFIEMLIENVEVIELAAEKDYRLSHLKALSTVYYTPIDKHALSFLESSFRELTNNARPTSRIIEVSGRQITIPKAHGDVAWVSFKELCENPLGASDYIEIAREFSTLILADIPAMDFENRNEAKRFVTLIDELYERKVKLICTANAEPDKLYPEGDGSFEFARTASRLIEMQSTKYLKQGHMG